MFMIRIMSKGEGSGDRQLRLYLGLTTAYWGDLEPAMQPFLAWVFICQMRVITLPCHRIVVRITL